MASHQTSNQRGKHTRKHDEKQKSDSSESWSENDPREPGAIQELTDDESSNYFSRRATEFRDQVRDCTRDHEGSALFVTLATGFGIGILVGAALVTSRRRPNRWRDRIAAEGIGRKFMDRLESILPESLSERFVK